MSGNVRGASPYVPSHPKLGARTTAPLPPALSLIAITIFLPEQLSFYILGLRLTATRLIFLLLLPFLAQALRHKITTGRYHFVLSDLFVPLTGSWMILASASVAGLGDALNHAGPDVLEFCVAYMATRLLLSSRGQAVSFINLLSHVIALVGLVSVLDPVTNHMIIHDVLADLTGYTKPPLVTGTDYRLGMLRAAGPLEHPILLGITCMVGLLFAVAIPLQARAFTMVACAIGLFVSLSSAPIQAAIMGCGLLVYNRVLANFRLRWITLIGLVAAAVAISFSVLGSPLGFINANLLFDAESGYAREFEWQTVGLYVQQSPWLGIGFGWGEIADQIGAFASIDSLWLGEALVYGIPASVLIALSLVGSASLPAERPGVWLTSVETRLATILGIIMFLFLFLGFTVYFWGSVWILAGLLSGVRAHLGELGRIALP